MFNYLLSAPGKGGWQDWAGLKARILYKNVELLFVHTHN
jgi:hypothetical protein